jgi:Short C-terminal domain
MSLADELGKLRDLQTQGALTDAEFEQAKAKVLAAPPPDPEPDEAIPIAHPAPRPHRIGMAVVCLRVLAALEAVAPLLVMAFTQSLGNERLTTALFPLLVTAVLLSLPFAVGLWVVAAGLQKRRFWAWVAGLCVFGLCLTSVLLPLGVFGLWGLLDSGSLAAIGVGGRARRRAPAAAPHPEERVVSAEVSLPKYPSP